MVLKRHQFKLWPHVGINYRHACISKGKQPPPPSNISVQSESLNRVPGNIVSSPSHDPHSRSSRDHYHLALISMGTASEANGLCFRDSSTFFTSSRALDRFLWLRTCVCVAGLCWVKLQKSAIEKICRCLKVFKTRRNAVNESLLSFFSK